MIRRYYLASPAAKILHIGPVERGALDRTVCGHLIVIGAGGSWVEKGIVSDRTRARMTLEVCKSCDRMKDVDTMAAHRRPHEVGT